MNYDVTGWSTFQLERNKQKKLEMIERIGAKSDGTTDEKIEAAKQIASLQTEVLELEKEIAYKEKLGVTRS